MQDSVSRYVPPTWTLPSPERSKLRGIVVEALQDLEPVAITHHSPGGTAKGLKSGFRIGERYREQLTEFGEARPDESLENTVFAALVLRPKTGPARVQDETNRYGDTRITWRPELLENATISPILSGGPGGHERFGGGLKAGRLEDLPDILVDTLVSLQGSEPFHRSTGRLDRALAADSATARRSITRMLTSERYRATPAEVFLRGATPTKDAIASVAILNRPDPPQWSIPGVEHPSPDELRRDRDRIRSWTSAHGVDLVDERSQIDRSTRSNCMDLRIAPVAPVPAAPVPARGQTQTQLAASHLTPQSRKILPDALLDARIGRSTLAGSLNDQIRFRVDRAGSDPTAWPIVPDSPNAAALMQTAAGTELIRQLRTAVNSTGSLADKSKLKGFILTEDNESVTAAKVVSWLDDPSNVDGRQVARLGAKGLTKAAGDVMRVWGRDSADHVARAGAWHSRGWITFSPSTARAMLVSAGAYTPDAKVEPRLMNSAHYGVYAAYVPTHEVQHSITSPYPGAYQGDARWMEEGTANVFSRTPTFLAKIHAASNVRPEAYAARLKETPSYDPGWKPYRRPQLPADEQQRHDRDTARNYGDSQVVLRDLVRLAGGDFRSTAGKQRAFELLQGKSMSLTPGVLAKAIIARHGLDAKIYDRLRERIANAVDRKGGAQALAAEFGIDQ